jgi:hypothetical protein
MGQSIRAALAVMKAAEAMLFQGLHPAFQEILFLTAAVKLNERAQAEQEAFVLEPGDPFEGHPYRSWRTYRASLHLLQAHLSDRV